MTVVICFIAVQIIMFFFLYPLLVAGKWEDEQMQRLFEEKRAAEGRKELEDKMESQRDVLRMIEKEISKGSVPVRFAGMGFTEDTYHLVESKAKMNQLLDYFFRIGEFAALADKQVRSNVYMDAGFKKVNFRSAISELDRRNMEAAAKRWMKKKHPSFDGDVYVENTCSALFTGRKQCSIWSSWKGCRKYAIGSTDWKTWMYCFSVCCLTRWSGRMGRCTGILVPCIC